MKFRFLPYATCLLLIFLAACGQEQSTTQETTSEPITEPAASEDTPVAVSNQGVNISYNQVGSGDYTLVFVHGWCINKTYWTTQVDALKDAYTIVTMDLPGYGQSGRNRTEWTFENFGQDVNALIEQLNLKNVILIGHSMGGEVVLEAASNNPDVIALIGVDNFKEVGVEYTDAMKTEVAGFIELLQNDFANVAPAYASEALFTPQSDSLAKERVLEDFRNHDPTIAVPTLENLFAYTLDKEVDKLSSLSQTLYLINSAPFPIQKEGLDNSGVTYKVRDIEETGHYPMIEKPEEFTRILKETLEEIIASQATSE